jgi:hypothetical protein
MNDTASTMSELDRQVPDRVIGWATAPEARSGAWPP